MFKIHIKETNCSAAKLSCWKRTRSGLRTKKSSPLGTALRSPHPSCQFPHQIIPNNEVRMIHWFSDEREFIIKIYIFQSPDMCSQIPNLISM